MLLLIEARIKKRNILFQIKEPKCDKRVPFPQDFRLDICFDFYFTSERSCLFCQRGIFFYPIAFICGFSFVSVLRIAFSLILWVKKKHFLLVLNCRIGNKVDIACHLLGRDISSWILWRISFRDYRYCNVEKVFF